MTEIKVRRVGRRTSGSLAGTSSEPNKDKVWRVVTGESKKMFSETSTAENMVSKMNFNSDQLSGKDENGRAVSSPVDGLSIVLREDEGSALHRA